MNQAIPVLSFIAVVLGFASGAVGALAALISAQANMSFSNSLPRAGCAFLLVGGLLLALGIWGLKS